MAGAQGAAGALGVAGAQGATEGGFGALLDVFHIPPYRGPFYMSPGPSNACEECIAYQVSLSLSLSLSHCVPPRYQHRFSTLLFSLRRTCFYSPQPSPSSDVCKGNFNQVSSVVWPFFFFFLKMAM